MTRDVLLAAAKLSRLARLLRTIAPHLDANRDTGWLLRLSVIRHDLAAIADEMVAQERKRGAA